jgi:hypothetical protein
MKPKRKRKRVFVTKKQKEMNTTVTYAEMQAYLTASQNWVEALKEYFVALPENEDIDIGSNPPPPPPPPPGL